MCADDLQDAGQSEQVNPNSSKIDSFTQTTAGLHAFADEIAKLNALSPSTKIALSATTKANISPQATPGLSAALASMAKLSELNTSTKTALLATTKANISPQATPGLSAALASMAKLSELNTSTKTALSSTAKPNISSQISNGIANSRPNKSSENYVSGGNSSPSKQDNVPDLLVDVFIITAVDDEYTALKKVFNEEWKIKYVDGIFYDYIRLEIDSGEITIATTHPVAMGLVPASISLMKAVHSLKPKFLAMTGICAGAKRNTKLGDLIVASCAFEWAGGKILENGELVPDYDIIAANSNIPIIAHAMVDNGNVIAKIFENFSGHEGIAPPQSKFSIHVGPIGSGGSVVTNKDIVKIVESNKRSLLGIDMEAYALAKVAHSFNNMPSLIVKCVQDKADGSKNDDYREFGCYASAYFLKTFLENHYSIFQL